MPRLQRESRAHTKRLEGSVRGLRVGIPRELLNGVSAQVRVSFDNTLSTMEDMGMIVEEMSIPPVHSPHAAELLLCDCSSRASSNLSRFDGVRFGRRPCRDTDEMYTKSRGEGLERKSLSGYPVTFVL